MLIELVDKIKELSLPAIKLLHFNKYWICFIMNTSLPNKYKKCNYHDILPIEFNDFTIKKLTWENFKGEPDQKSKHQAMTYWYITYFIKKKEY